MAKILIVGCGAIGGELALTLSKNGHDVTGLKRNPPTGNRFFQYFRADITSAQDLALLNTNFDYIFFIVSSGSRDENSYRAIYETGLNNLIDRFAQSCSQASWFFVSSTSVYGQNHGEWVDENSPTLPNNVTGKLLLAAEQKLTALNTNNVIVRFSGIYGPGREYLLRMAMQTPQIQHEPPAFTNRIHQVDCVGILVFLFECRLQGRHLEQYYLASDDNPAPLWEVISWLTQQMHKEPPVPLDLSGNANMNKRCQNNRIKTLGYQFMFPDFKSGYARIIASKSTINQILQ